MAGRRIYSRKWLEISGTDIADSFVRVEGTISGPGKWNHIDLKLADCDRRIQLSFGWQGEVERKQRLSKLARLEAALGLIRYALENQK